MTAIITEDHIQRRRLLGSGPKETGRLFLVGDGGSLDRIPFGLLIGETCWATGRIQNIYDRTFWRPTRYWAAEYPRTPEQEKDFIFHLNQGYDCWVRRELSTHLSTRKANLTVWTDSPSGGFAAIKSNSSIQLRTLLQAAMESGYDPVYLLGFDVEDKAHTVAKYEFKAAGKEIFDLGEMLTIYPHKVYNKVLKGLQ